jgi:hypothetical protein
MTNHGRDSIDGLGMPLISTINFDDAPFDGFPYQNAFWSGTQMVYGPGFASADDVVAHELTHGVTNYESNLFYFWQSGAISESFSDVWGEFMDLTNGMGTDTDATRWQIGEDLSIGAIRNMRDPTIYSDPDKMTSPFYYTADGDNGGVHINSGVNNKAAYLMVDGGTFNGQTITGLGITKVAKIYYYAQSNLLTSGSDYADLYYALQASCAAQIGTAGITSADCLEVLSAVNAVEMNLQPVEGYNPDTAACDQVGEYPVNSFFDDLEAGSANWLSGAISGTDRWSYNSIYSPNAHSGQHFLYADDYPATATDSYISMITSVTVPPNGKLLFHHAYALETGYDGGMLEYSTNGGSSWTDAGLLMDGNGYNATLASFSGNPLGGRDAFTGNSHGYISTRLNLSSLAGQNVKFRFRMGLDIGTYALGWWLDDVQMYECRPVTRIFGDVPALYWANSFIERLYNAGITGGCSVTPLNYCPDSIVTRAQMAIFLLKGIHGSSYIPPSVGASTGFTDVATDYWAAAWIKQLAAESITSGCGAGVYCPDATVTRAQMAVFLLKAKYDAAFDPPFATGVFIDVPVSYWAAKWIERLAVDGITSGCGTGIYCPDAGVTRAQMAVFLVKTFGLP